MPEEAVCGGESVPPVLGGRVDRAPAVAFGSGVGSVRLSVPENGIRICEKEIFQSFYGM